ncbi:FAD-dependent oxidoreductase [Candidatus Saccharibacteria bacterium]|nr:FAD-dependent oxidoreductase [Candidatus Saccharibacteria bacterium]MBP9985972.1 FAD-dependent oxidoreductase [Candidatus Saccharibacteria bacterium]
MTEAIDTIMIGAGPSALAAAVYTTREDIKTDLYEKAVVGGLAAITDQIDNYPGFPEGISGMQLASDLEKQAKRFGANIKYGDVKSISRKDNQIVLNIDGKDVLAKTVLIATGSDYNKIGIPGEAEYYGRGVHYCATCDGAFYRDQDLIVVGGGNSAIQEAIFLTRFAKKIDLLVRSKIKASEVLQKDLQKYIDSGQIVVHLETVPTEILGDEKGVYKVLAKGLTGENEIITNGVFVFIGLKPNTQFLQGSGVELDEVGLVKTNKNLETNIPGIFASGDVRSGATMQIASAVGEGATAALSIRHYLENNN